MTRFFMDLLSLFLFVSSLPSPPLRALGLPWGGGVSLDTKEGGTGICSLGITTIFGDSPHVLGTWQCPG